MRYVRILALVALCLAYAPTPALAVTGYDSAYSGESAFVNIQPGETQSFQVFFSNTGTLTWTKGGDTQVDLAACLADKVTCPAQDPADSTWNSGWLSATRYATTTQATVAPGTIATFGYSIKAPSNATAGTNRFNGDLVVSSSGARIHPEGYYQDATVQAIGNIPVPTPTPTPGSTPFPSAPPQPVPTPTPTPIPQNFTVAPWAYACGDTTYGNPATATDTGMEPCPTEAYNAETNPNGSFCPEGTDVLGTATASFTAGKLTLTKAGPTCDQLAAGATIGGLSHLTTASFTVDGYCGAGAPRLNVTTGDGKTHFYGCSANNDGGSVSINFSDASKDGSGNGGFIPTDTVTAIDFVLDEGTDLGSGTTSLSNIKFNNMGQ